MKSLTVPLVSGSTMTFFIGSGHLAVVESKKDPKMCRMTDGMHNNGGWEIALPAAKVVALIKAAT